MSLKNIDPGSLISTRLDEALQLIDFHTRNSKNFQEHVKILTFQELEDLPFEKEVGYILRILNECAYGDVALSDADAKRFHILYRDLVTLFYAEYFEKKSEKEM